MVAVSLNGPDNVGKSTQVRLLARRTGATDAGPLDRYDPRWAVARQTGLADWWFSSAPIEEVVDVLACSYLGRAASVPVDGRGLVLFDRGLAMLEASVAATVAVREKHKGESATDRALELLAPYRADLDRTEVAELRVLLLHEDGVRGGVTRSLAREAKACSRYAAYQLALHTQLHAQAKAGRYAETLVTGDNAVLSVHSVLCQLLRDNGIDVPAPALERVRVIALGGMSESGKSTAGHYLQARHGYARLKISYLLDQAAVRHGVTDPYELEPTSMTELLVDGLESYCAAHHFQRRVSIESLHRLEVSRELGKFLGDRLTTVYLEAKPVTRAARGVAGAADVRERDAVKRSRGAEQIRTVADVVIDNNHPVLALYHSLDVLVAAERWPLTTPQRTAVEELNLPTHLRSYLDGLLEQLVEHGEPLVSLLAVTGSGARGKYQQGWSDLDVLVVAETDRLPELSSVLANLEPGLQGVKLGFTVISPAECQAGALTPRLLHTLTMIGSGQLPVLWCADDLCLPHPDAETDTWSSLRDGAMAAVEIRRQLLRQHLDVRSLYKVTALLAKVMLRTEGREFSGDAEALLALATSYPQVLAHGGNPEQARQDQETLLALAKGVLNWWIVSVSAVGTDRRCPS